VYVIKKNSNFISGGIMEIFEPFIDEALGCTLAMVVCGIAAIDGIRAVILGCPPALTNDPLAQAILGVIGVAFFFGKHIYDERKGPPKHKMDRFWLG
jgi:hypothetical protein